MKLKKLLFFVVVSILALSLVLIKLATGTIYVDGPLMQSIADQLSFGPRYVGSNGHQKVRQYIQKSLKSTDAAVFKQAWVDEETGMALENYLARFNPEARRRIIIAAHYDTDPTAKKDKHRSSAPVPGASDGASATAVLLQLAKTIKSADIDKDIGLDLVFLDAENYDAGSFSDWHPKGSGYFARNIGEFYAQLPESALVVDMVCDKNLNFNQEKASLQSANGTVSKVWQIGRALDPKAFSGDQLVEIKDDHNQLISAGIPSMVLIDLDYPYHDTTADSIDKCSEKSLVTTLELLKRYVQASAK